MKKTRWRGLLLLYIMAVLLISGCGRTRIREDNPVQPDIATADEGSDRDRTDNSGDHDRTDNSGDHDKTEISDERDRTNVAEREKRIDEADETAELNVKYEIAENNELAEGNSATTTNITNDPINSEKEEAQMKFFINDQEIPVIWEENQTVKELQAEAAKGDIVVKMSMYSDNEQVGPLGRRYSSKDRQTTTHNGDIVLYNSSNIVVFYGSNSWAYTRLGKMDLPEKDVINLLSDGDVTVTIK